MILSTVQRRRHGHGPQYMTVVIYRCENCGRVKEAKWNRGRPYRYCSRSCIGKAQSHTWITQTPTDRSVQIAEQYERDPHYGALAALAREHGISRERVRRIVARQQELRHKQPPSEPKGKDE